MSTSLTCCICSAPTNYAHFGINSCRSCAEFYKRSVLADRAFACRKGDGKCTIVHGDRHNCRGCRLVRCRQMGMKLTDQKPAEPHRLEPSTSAEYKDTLISRISREYSASVERRKACEYTLRPTSLHRHVKAEFAENLLLCSWRFMIDVLKMYAGEYIQFASACFPEFASFPLDDQRLLLRNFASRLFLAEGQCGTFRNFGSYDGPHFMATLTTCHDSRNFKFFIEEEIPDSYKEVVKVTEYYTERGRRLLGPILAKSQFTEVEYAVLFALSIWQIDLNQNLPDHIVEMSDKVRRQIFESLKEYYQKELGLSNYSVRLGNLTTFEHIIQEGTNLLNEEVQAYNLTGMLTADISFLQIVMQISL
ncbi:hypothetical protein PMAYCL1PPCAC_17358 [Pristionchus mayeri]|uniref:Nuclear receptor n=1 Tax=Pristionchus mayeri TaxID=1317129 RepID=A0AAN5CMH7_9BILA|nr:hypothetical protein PMAYCL1PPCAC_17358 [Pristionchus mayeri]